MAYIMHITKSEGDIMFTLVIFKTELDSNWQCNLYLSSESNIILRKMYNDRNIKTINTVKIDSITAARAIQARLRNTPEVIH